MVKVAALLTGVFFVWTPPGAALRAAAAEGAVLLTRLLAWAAGPILVVFVLSWVMGVLARHPGRAGSPVRWLALAVVLVLGVVCVGLLEPLPSAAGDAAGRAGAATVDFALAQAAALLPEPESPLPRPAFPPPVGGDLRRVACVAPEPTLPLAVPVLAGDSVLEARWC